MPAQSPPADLAAVCALWANPSSCVAAHCLSDLHCHVCTCDQVLQPWKCMLIPKASTAACGPGSSPVSYHWPVPLCSPAASCSSYIPHATSLTPDARLHCWHQRSEPEASSLTASGALQLALVLTACPASHQCVCVCLQLAPATTQLPAAGFLNPSVCTPLAPATTDACPGP